MEEGMKRWEGKVAIVTGASQGVGAAIAKQLAISGMIVCGLAKRKDKVEALRVGLLKIKGQLNAVECDIANEASVAQAFTWVEKTFGGIDLLINNGGVFTKCLLTDENNSKEVRNIIDSELMGMILCTRQAIKSMKTREVNGHVVNINSILGHKVNQAVPGSKPTNSLYPTIKYALTGFTECIRQELLYLQTQIKVTVSIARNLRANQF
jgi:NADP+-dependent farnesol dehydrogenase